jgi:hemerythrin-like domain-containing protein
MVFKRLGPRSADFDDPLQMLEACHDRIRMQCDTLGNLAQHMLTHGCDAQAQQAASNVMRYFDSAGRHHHEDEELDLFPRMLAVATDEHAEWLASLLDRLVQEHREMEQVWLRLRKNLELIAHGENAALNALDISQFCETYSAHIALEETEVIPFAARLLAREDLAALGLAMAARREIRQ